MLPAEARLRRGSDVVAAIRRGKRGHSTPVTVHVRLPAGNGQASVAVVGGPGGSPASAAAHLDVAASRLRALGRLDPSGAPVARPAMMRADTRPARVAFVVPKAVGGAVARNLVKRRLRHVVRAHLNDLPAGADIVVRVAPPAATASASELGRAFRRALTTVTSTSKARQ